MLSALPSTHEQARNGVETSREAGIPRSAPRKPNNSLPSAKRRIPRRSCTGRYHAIGAAVPKKARGRRLVEAAPDRSEGARLLPPSARAASIARRPARAHHIPGPPPTGCRRSWSAVVAYCGSRGAHLEELLLEGTLEDRLLQRTVSTGKSVRPSRSGGGLEPRGKGNSASRCPLFAAVRLVSRDGSSRTTIAADPPAGTSTSRRPRCDGPSLSSM